MPIPKAIARFNRFVTNPILGLVSGWAPGFAIIRHRGRRSGKIYTTPVNIFAVDGGFIVALTYGANVDWVKNVISAGVCSIRHRREEIALVDPAFVSTAEGLAAMPLVVRTLLGLLNVTEFLRLSRAKSRSGFRPP